MLKASSSIISASQIATPITFAGNVTLSTGNLIMSDTKGIDFSATPGTGTSELLNDYEEGTWTATLTGSTTSPTIPVSVTARYTKIGNIVSIFASFGNVTTTGASGDMRVTGLPFTSGLSRAFGMSGLDKIALTGVFAYNVIYDSANTVLFLESVSNAYGPAIAIPSTTGVFMQFSITYQV